MSPAPSDTPNPRYPRPSRFLLPPVVFLLYNALLIVLDKFIPLGQVLPMPWSMLGLIPIVVGTIYAFWTVWMFRKNHTALKPFHPSTTLMTGGTFRLSRNPIYLGMVVVMVGIAMTAGSVSVWIVPPLLAITFHYRFIRHEEPMLRETFGEAYTDYCEKVRRWI